MIRKSMLVIGFLLAALPAGPLSAGSSGDLDPDAALERIVELLSPPGSDRALDPLPLSATARRMEAFRLLLTLPEAVQLEVRRLFSPPVPLACVESELYPIRSCYNFPDEASKAEIVLAYAEFSWLQEVEELGFRPPRRGSGTATEEGLDLFLGDTLSYGAAGYTSPVDMDASTPITDCTVYIVLNQDEPAGDFLKATTVHEINHGCQTAMDCLETLSSMEATATWTEYLLVPEIDFTFGLTIGDFQQFPNRSVGWRDNYDIYVYGAALFMRFLDEFMGDGDPRFISGLWEGSVQTAAENEPDLLDAIVAAAEAKTISPEDLFGEFGEWRYFVGRNDDGEHFEGGDEWWGAEVKIDRSFYVSSLDSLPLSYTPSVQPLGYSYAQVDFGGGSLPEGRMILEAEGPADSPFLLQAWFIDGNRLTGRVGGESGDETSVKLVMDSDELAGGSRMTFLLAGMGKQVDWDQQWRAAAYTVTFDHVPRPRILSVSPGTLILGRPETLVVTGDYLSEGTEVSISGEGVDILGTQPTDSGEILVSVDVSRDGPEGTRDLTVRNGGPGLGLETTLPDALELTAPLPPGIGALAPDRGLPGESLLVRVDGERLGDAVAVAFGCAEIDVTSLQVAGGGVLFVGIDIPADAEPRVCDFTATDDFGRTSTLRDAFRIEAPPEALEEVEPAGGGCGCTLADPLGPVPASTLLSLLLAFLAWMRRRA